MNDHVDQRLRAEPSIRNHQLLVGTLLVIGVWNVIGNLLLPSDWYIPANVAVAACLIVASRRAGCGWDDLGLGTESMASGVKLGMTQPSLRSSPRWG